MLPALILTILCEVTQSELREPNDAPVTIGWEQIPNTKLPKAPRRPPKSRAAKERLRRTQAAFFKDIIGARFYGLCEVHSVAPNPDSTGSADALLVTAVECANLIDEDPDDIPGATLTPDGWSRRVALWAISENPAMHIARGQRFNIAGTITEVSVTGSGGPDDFRIIGVRLKDVKH